MDQWRSAARDAGILLSFRAGHLRGRSRRRARIAGVVVALITVAAAWLPQYIAQPRPTRYDVLVLLPTAFLGFLFLTAIAATVAGGGREVLSRDEASSFPIAPRTEFLVSLVLAPLNIAWLMEAWTLLASLSYGYGPHWQVAIAQLVTVAWIVAATVLGQMLAAGFEWIRRMRGGVFAVRTFGLALAGLGGWLVITGRLGHWMDHQTITRWLVNAQLQLNGNHWSHLLFALAALSAVTIVAAVLGGLVADRAARRQAIDELRLESGQRFSRANPTSDFMAMLRLDRASVWRAVPLRRGILFLGVLPGAIALAGSLRWQAVIMFPGLVCSGGALLFGVNIWCLDARGAIWRESLPARSSLAFLARSWVLAELLLVSLVPALGLGALRAGTPTLADLAALASAAVVTVVFVTGRCLRWSVTKPYPADLRGARATPAPPLAMVGYSARLAFTTTILGLLFYVTSTGSWLWSVLLATPMVLLAASDLAHTARQWEAGETRAIVLAAVAA